MSELIGKTISHYRILEELGRGGMGVVYKAKDTKLKRTVALKFLPHHLLANEDDKTRFLHEAQSASALNHPNIMTIHEIDEFEGEFFIAMEYVEGETLKDKLEKGPLKTKELLNITIAVADGLNAAHEQEIVHRDIKSENIMIPKTGIVKITDFGLAKRKGMSRITKTGSTLGTLAYMSPEQAEGLDVDRRSDLFSFGVVLYEMATGQQPFRGEHDAAILYSIVNEAPLPVNTLNPNIPQELERIIHKALEKEPEDRYQHADDLAADLKKLQKEPAGKVELPPSIAVLPFVNISADPDNEYFSDGLTEELINAFTQLKDLRVVARTSSFVFKGKEIDIREIGNRLNVQKVLEGSVRKAGSRIRVTAQLINIEDGYHEWSERYDRDLEDVFAIQDEISREIANKFKTRFREKRKPEDVIATQDVGAYELYLKGRYYFNKFSPEWINKAIDSFSEAIVIDPDFALAYAGLAEAYVFLSTPFGALESTVAMPKAKNAAEQALELHPNLSEAYVSLGAIATFYDWDREKAHHYFDQAITLNPSNVNARLWYELALSLLDQEFDEAMAHLKVALNLDPLNLLILLRMGYVYCYKYDFEAAINFFKKIVHLEPNYATGYHGLLDVYGLKGEYELAITQGEKSAELSKYAPSFVSVLGLYCARGEEQKRAKELLSMLLERSETEPVSPFWIGVIYMGLNELDHMFEWFEKAYEQRDGNLLYLFAPPFDSVREDPRFIKLHKKMGFEI